MLKKLSRIYKELLTVGSGDRKIKVTERKFVQEKKIMKLFPVRLYGTEFTALRDTGALLDLI